MGDLVLRSGHRIAPHDEVLVAVPGGLEERGAADLSVGDWVAVKYGGYDWPTELVDLAWVPSGRAYGSQRAITMPATLTTELALVLGCYVAEGHVTRSNWTVHVTNSVASVLALVADLWERCFGLPGRVVLQQDRCPTVKVSSKSLVEYLDVLGCGGRASEKRIPPAVLDSPREAALAFLQGLALDAYTTTAGTTSKWALCVDSAELLDDLQVLLTRLGVVHGRVEKWNPKYQKSYGEVYACGPMAAELSRLVPFLEPEKEGRAGALRERTFAQSSADVVPFVTGPELHALLPNGRGQRGGWGPRSTFSFLRDPRSQMVSRRTIERLVGAGVRLPEPLTRVVDENLHFSQVVAVPA